MKVFGVVLIIGSIIFTAWLLTKDNPNIKGVLTLCVIVIFVGIVLILNERATEIIIKGVGTIKLAAKTATIDAKAINELRTRIQSEADEIHQLKEKLDNMFKLNASGEIQTMRTLNTGRIEFETDSGLVTAMNMPVSPEPTE